MQEQIMSDIPIEGPSVLETGAYPIRIGFSNLAEIILLIPGFNTWITNKLVKDFVDKIEEETGAVITVQDIVVDRERNEIRATMIVWSVGTLVTAQFAWFLVAGAVLLVIIGLAFVINLIRYITFDPRQRNFPSPNGCPPGYTKDANNVCQLTSSPPIQNALVLFGIAAIIFGAVQLLGKVRK